MSAPAGWYDDGSGRQRWWDGEQWTDHYAPETPDLPEEGGTVLAGSDTTAGTAPDARESGSYEPPGQTVLAVEPSDVVGDAHARKDRSHQPQRRAPASPGADPEQHHG